MNRRAFVTYGNNPDGSDRQDTPIFKSLRRPDGGYDPDLTADNRAYAAVPQGFKFQALFAANKPGLLFSGEDREHDETEAYSQCVYVSGVYAPEEAE